MCNDVIMVVVLDSDFVVVISFVLVAAYEQTLFIVYRLVVAECFCFRNCLSDEIISE